jgi:hypothetical protein
MTKRIIGEVLINEPSVENMKQIIKLAEGFFRSYNQIPDLWMNLG